MKKVILILAGVLLTQNACDLQPRVVSLPDTVGEFISARYPALLADPYANPEIYNSAASDYGVYAAPDLLYGTKSNDDYIVYASVNDYVAPVQSDTVALYGQEIVSDTSSDGDVITVPSYTKSQNQIDDKNAVTVQKGDTLYGLSKKYGLSVQDLAEINNLSEPYKLTVGYKLLLTPENKIVDSSEDVLNVRKPVSGVKKTMRIELQEITVASGDTLYSLSRKYSVPVNDLAVLNKLTPPFNLSVGQKLRVPNFVTAPVVNTVKTSAIKSNKADVVPEKQNINVVSAPVKKISSDPSKKLPTISARSSSKFAWPVRGKILSGYGAKSNGLFNDGINISANRGTAVKAAENGVVAYAGNEVKGMGNLIIVQHDGGWMTVYAHMDSMDVRRGRRVSVGQKIGTVGETGKVDSPQLHFEIRKGTKAYNPSSYLKK
jgi:murein DD-endopeptidase MepM/ murein hydrolase activator NlpD